MEQAIYYGFLYDQYQALLTEKQQQYFEDYYFQNLSLSEMAEKYEVSRNAIHNQVQLTIKKLVEYEEKLGLQKKKEQVLALIIDEKVKDKITDLL